MVFSMTIGGDYNSEVKLIAVKRKVARLVDCDKNGNKCKRVYTQKAEYSYEDEKGKKVENVYKLNPKTGKPMAKLTRTTFVKTFLIVPKEEATDLLSELYYVVVSKELKAKLKGKKALKFAFSNGNGFKSHIAYIFEEGDRLLMICGFGYKSKIEVDEVAEKDIEIEDGVEQADASEMLAIVGQA